MFNALTGRSPKLSDHSEEHDLILAEKRERDLTLHDLDARLIFVRARAQAISWGFGAFIVTIVLGIASFVALDIAKLETNTLREWLQTTIAGEIGLIAGLLGSRER